MTLSDPPRAPAVALDDVPLLMFMPAEVKALVTASFVPVTFPFGTEVVSEGEEADAFYVVASGRARVVKSGEGGEEVPLETLAPGDSFGEAALLEGRPRTATVRASTELTVFRLDGAVFRALLATNPALRDAVELQHRHRALTTFLALYSPFARLAPDALAAMLRGLEPVTVDEGDVVMREGEEAGPMYVVEEGRLRAWRQRNGEAVHLAFYRKGDAFGERSLFTGAPRAATVEAVTPSRLLRMGAETFGRLVADHPDFRRHIEDRVAQYDFEQVARVPLDFAQELLPADAEAIKETPPPAVDEGRMAEQSEEVKGPFVTADGRFAKSPKRIRRFPRVYQIDEADCGAACMAMVCRHFGKAVGLNRIRQEVGTGIEGTSLRGIVGGAARLGLAARAVKASRRNLEHMPLPAVLHWGGNHWVVLYDVGPTHVRVADPAIGLRRLPRAELDEKWTGYAALLEYTEAFEKAPEGEAGPKWLWQFFRPHRRTILTAAVLALAVAGLQMALPVFVQIVVDRVLPRRDFDLLQVLLLSLAGLLVAMTVGSLLQRYLLARAAVGIDGASLDFLSGRLLALPMTWFYNRRSGDVIRRLSGVRLVREFAVQSGVVAITSVAQISTAVVLMFVYNRALAFVFLAMVPAYVVAMRVAVKRLRPVLDNLEESFGRYYSRQIDAIKGMESVKAMGAEHHLQAQLLREFEGLGQRLFRADFTSMCYDGAVQLLSFVSLGLFLWVGALQVLDGNLSIGGLVSFSALVGLANPALVVLLSMYDQFQYSSILMNRLNDVFDEEPEQGHDRSHLSPVPTLDGRVTLERVGFRYGGPAAPLILDGITVDVPPGTTVAVVGRSGSGKSTLAKCLAGLLEPTEGRILYDGVDMTTLDYRSLRRHIGFVLQENFLFSDTVGANIAFGDDEPDAERIVWAAHVANAHDFIDRLPLRYHTMVGETGLLLSGGQRQRVAIARAVYHRPPVLVLDEATSSLDAESERGVKESMDRLLRGRTSIVIAHRLSTIVDADLILVLERGRLVESGTHDQLMARRGLYFYLSSQQLVT